ncbi:hypothetical protein P154DRAFT_520581 [Amniculicola lignicola CBS 123094]|uniref:Uncharacterized protein n=1 Tax=Amniculicola lignicola CBS 123094 TaxID=1392246 RepID=A0A6A5WLU0_9PLEO|nr:hypothetical protein P154DRAFT_520581 [Amniculicola lignicola CBS 123094]
MHYSALLLAFASGALAQVVTDSIGFSVLSVLATAIPSESISAATANPVAFSKELASSLSAGKTPDWYNALPSDVKSYLPKLYPATTEVSSTPSSTAAPSSTPSSITPSITPSASASASISPSSALNSTVISTVRTPTLSATGSDNSAAASSTESQGGAAYPTAIFGAGVAGVVGILGMLAL